MNLSSATSRKQQYQNVLKKLRKLEIFISSICIFGILTCLYVLRVEINKERDTSYRALCDFSEYISCSKVFSSK